jgi:endonuclease/exonuclease/phosphatase family metal-dependent hydrolase
MLMLKLLVLTAAICALSTGSAHGAQPPIPTGIAVLTFNIRYANPGDGDNAWSRRREQVFAIIRGQARPDGVNEPFDFVGVQEALAPQLEDMVSAVPGVYGRIGVGRDDGQGKGEYSAILYRKDRWVCDGSGTFWLSDTPEVAGSKSWGNGITRICTWGRFRRVEASGGLAPGLGGPGDPAAGAGAGGGGAIYVFNTHLDHQSQPSRERAAALIAQRMAAIAGDASCILTGDFNSGEANPVIAYLTGQQATPFTSKPAADIKDPKPEADTAAAVAPPSPKLVDTFRAIHPDERVVGTFNNFDAKKTDGDKIDFVLVDPRWKVEKAWIDRRTWDEGKRTPSDHWAVGAVVRLR